MKRREPLSHIMTPNPIRVNVTNTLAEAEAMMKEHNVRHLPVASGDKVVGMLALTDLLRVSFVNEYDTGGTALYQGLSIDKVMAKEPESLQQNQDIRVAAEILSKREFHALPVLNDKKLVGIVTTTDLIKYLLDQY